MVGNDDSPVEASADISNPRDVQGYLAVGFGIGWHVIAGAALAFRLVDASVVITGEVGIVNAIIAWYFRGKSGQAPAQ